MARHQGRDCSVRSGILSNVYQLGRHCVSVPIPCTVVRRSELAGLGGLAVTGGLLRYLSQTDSAHETSPDVYAAPVVAVLVRRALASAVRVRR